MGSWGGKMVRTAALCVRGAMDLLLPRVCLACGANDAAADGLCQPCNLKLLTLVAMPYCPRCGSTLGAGVKIREDGCYACPTTLPRFARVVRLGPYAQPLRDIIHQVKYRRQEGLCRHLCRLLGGAIEGSCQQDEPGLEMVLPVPAHWRRRIARAYDHSGALATALAEELSLHRGSELIRIRHTPPQAHLPKTRRIENVRGAFSVSDPKVISGARVLLVDDVTTTGATANEAARALLAAGASQVVLAVIAKADPPKAYEHAGKDG